METKISNKTLWVLKRAELLNNPEKKRGVIETHSNRSSVGGVSKDGKEVSINAYYHQIHKKKLINKTKSISDLPDFKKETPVLLKNKYKRVVRDAPNSIILDKKYEPNLPSISQISANIFLSKADINNIEDVLSPSDLFESPLIKKRIVHSKKLDSDASIALTCRYNRLETSVALGCEDGVTKIIDLSTSKKVKLKSDVTVAVTSVRWNPKRENILYQTRANGEVEIWNIATNSKELNFNEAGNFIFCSDFNSDGTFFSTAGQDAQIRVYDAENLGKPINTFSRLSNPTHANRIYSLKFYDDNKNLIVSGGWDETLILWDIRTPYTANFIYGPLICGDSLDLGYLEILTGSWRETRQIQIWDMRNLKEKANLEWKVEMVKEKSFIYSCAFEKKAGKFIIAGSSGTNEIRFFENGKKYECLDIEVGFKKGIYSLDSARLRNQFCYGSEQSGIYSYY